jgi:hypothetical protein
MTWSRHHDKLWLSYVHNGMRYEIPFNEQTRFVDGSVLVNNTKNPGLVAGMISAESHLDNMREDAEEVTAVREAYEALEAYQWHQLVQHGVAAEFATGPREPVVA